MNVRSTLRALGPIDLRNVQRDSMLRWMLFLPILTALIVRWLLPWITVQLQDTLNLTPYYPLIMSYAFITLVPLMFGVVIGFLLLDERDDQTLIALQITPLSLRRYLSYRISVPMVFSVCMLLLVYPIAGLVLFSFLDLVIVGIAAAPIAPLLALVLAAFSANKVQGFAVMKGIGGLLILPLLAWFVPMPWQLLFGIFPTYWPVKTYWVLDAGEPYAGFYFVVGLVYMSLLIVWLTRRFDDVLHNQ